ncbi:hypothetical protein K469DRAFT_664179 [Zopfia rhizophila CBS 207.26]|uniref:HTH CENPB-type domain-containing protein n=1 Tax=Zopfia rhizophila CBS 207.26 TaxID=1314779 RepID=A0A6A6E7Y7_9PEZI|nr:hypothetical protein K469DRAFT_664179 [Zopfia rhizophila CBS 207.26]
MPHMIHDAAEVILNAGSHPPFLPQYLGRDWVTRFLAAHPELIKKKQKPKDKDRIDAQRYEEIREFYEKYKKVVAEYGIQQCDTWNFDETGFRVGCGSNQVVVTYRQ